MKCITSNCLNEVESYWLVENDDDRCLSAQCYGCSEMLKATIPAFMTMKEISEEQYSLHIIMQELGVIDWRRWIFRLTFNYADMK